MSNQEVFDMLANLEEFFRSKARCPEDLAPFLWILMEMHRSANTLLRQWHNLTGCTNDYLTGGRN